MADTLIICEKSSQAKDIRAALGGRFGEVLPAQGHILTLKEPDDIREDWKTWSADLLWPGKFYEKVPVPSTKRLLDAIKTASKSVKRIIIATDCDREGQLIGDEIVEHIGFRGEVLRCIFNAQDPKSLQTAFANLRPNSEFRGLYMSGQAREQADQTSNLSLTRTATVVLKAPGAKGAIGIGRVKTPVLGIVCKRELEIQNFKPADMFEIDALTRVASGQLTLSCTRMPKSLVKEQELAADEDAEELGADEAALEDAESMVGRILKKDIAEGLRQAAEKHVGPLASKAERRKQAPPKLFDLTALQSTASSRFGWSGDRTLEVAQKLYSERTIITYPRGEAKYLPENNIADIKTMVPALLRLSGYGKHTELLKAPEARKGKSGHFSDKALEGMSHFAIIPNANMADQFSRIVPNLSEDEAKLFDVISRQYLAALAPDHEYRQTTIDMTIPHRGHDWDFRASGRVPLIPGWKAILGGAGSRLEDEGVELPDVKNGETGTVLSAKLRTVTTKPPARYTEGTLIKIMQEAWRLVPVTDMELRNRLKEAKGIGTPATRGDVVKGLFTQGQLVAKGKSIMPTDGGMKLYQTLIQVCPNVVDPARTAMWETIFDMVEKGKLTAEAAVLKILDATQKEIDRIKSNGNAVQITIGAKSKPTPKMVEFAKSISERKKIPLPRGYQSDSVMCRKFIDDNMPPRDPNAAPRDPNSPAGHGFPPSEKQLAFAQSISEQIKKKIPEEALLTSKALSGWMDSVKSKIPERPPSEKQLQFAQKLADESGKDLPENIAKSGKACSEYIDKMMKDAKSSKPKGNPGGYTKRSDFTPGY